MTEHHDHDAPLPDTVLRVKALESLLVEKGLVDPKALDVLIDTYENKVGPRNGARVVARAWVDEAYRQRLLSDATAAIAEFGFMGRQSEHMVVVENTFEQHNMVVCTLCSCYPWAVLGLPPVWYKSAPYRARAVLDPRGVLAEFGVSPGRPCGNPCLGQHGGNSLPGAAPAAGGYRRHGRRGTRRTRHPRLDDRRGARQSPR